MRTGCFNSRNPLPVCSSVPHRSEAKRHDPTSENRPNVQVWSWDEPVQYTVQNYNKEKDLRKSYQAVYNLGNGSIFQLANEELPNIQLGNEGDAPLALLSTSRPYSLSSMWEARTRSDYYTVSLDNGERKQIAQADYGRFRLSPQGKYAYWYGETDSCWYTIALAEGKQYRLTTPESFGLGRGERRSRLSLCAWSRRLDRERSKSLDL